jgi:methyl coenzyme M reductase subunit C-like uncharacterized protein (methanogenesis marker protein 7)
MTEYDFMYIPAMFSGAPDEARTTDGKVDWANLPIGRMKLRMNISMRFWSGHTSVILNWLDNISKQVANDPEKLALVAKKREEYVLSQTVKKLTGKKATKE